MKIFGKQEDKKKPKVFRASRNRNVCIYGPPEMMKKYREQNSGPDTEPRNDITEPTPEKTDDENGVEQE